MDENILTQLLTQLVEGQNALIKKLDSVIVSPPEEVVEETPTPPVKQEKKKGRPRGAKSNQVIVDEVPAILDSEDDCMFAQKSYWGANPAGPIRATGTNDFEKIKAFNSNRSDSKIDKVLGAGMEPRVKRENKIKMVEITCKGCSKTFQFHKSSAPAPKGFMCNGCLVKKRDSE